VRPYADDDADHEARGATGCCGLVFHVLVAKFRVPRRVKALRSRRRSRVVQVNVWRRLASSCSGALNVWQRAVAPYSAVPRTSAGAYVRRVPSVPRTRAAPRVGHEQGTNGSRTHPQFARPSAALCTRRSARVCRVPRPGLRACMCLAQRCAAPRRAAPPRCFLAPPRRAPSVSLPWRSILLRRPRHRSFAAQLRRCTTAAASSAVQRQRRTQPQRMR
jgi:hypothetical protein